MITTNEKTASDLARLARTLIVTLRPQQLVTLATLLERLQLTVVSEEGASGAARTATKFIQSLSGEQEDALTSLLARAMWAVISPEETEPARELHS